MTVTIKLPDNQKEANFIVELLQKLNISLLDDDSEDDISEAHKQILDERIEKLRNNPNIVYHSWEDVKKITAQRKVLA
jgi:hypothetical protein